MAHDSGSKMAHDSDSGSDHHSESGSGTHSTSGSGQHSANGSGYHRYNDQIKPRPVIGNKGPPLDQLYLIFHFLAGKNHHSGSGVIVVQALITLTVPAKTVQADQVITV